MRFFDSRKFALSRLIATSLENYDNLFLSFRAPLHALIRLYFLLKIKLNLSDAKICVKYFLNYFTHGASSYKKRLHSAIDYRVPAEFEYAC
jgi:hypothetical protein